MILADTSAWIEYLHRTESRPDICVDSLLRRQQEISTTDAVLMEVLAGARDLAERDALRRLLAACHFERIHGPPDYEDAADIYRACRRGGETVRSLVDCLTAAVAIRTESSLLHADTDFGVIARHTPLRLA